MGKLGLTTTVLARLSVGFGFTLRHDQNPRTAAHPERHALITPHLSALHLSHPPGPPLTRPGGPS